jgi:hypothetical protein
MLKYIASVNEDDITKYTEICSIIREQGDKE